MNDYQPELGQMMYGQPWQSHEGSELLEAALGHLDNELERVLWNRFQKACPSPFANTGARFDTDGLSIHAYSWGDDNQPWNFKCGDVEISWYKWCGRGLSSNRPMSPDEIDGLLNSALKIIRECDSRDEWEEQIGREFTYA